MHSLSTFRFGAFLLVLATVAWNLAGCAGASPPAASEAPSPAINRRAAIAAAREDAALRFGEVPAARVDAQEMGGMWIVELHRPDGSGLHYAISTVNGAIRERRTFQ
jgi:hypothetical protein